MTIDATEPSRTRSAAETRSAVTSNFLVSGLGQFLGIALAVVTVGVLTRALGRDGYGIYTSAFVFLNTLVQIGSIGLPVAQLHLMGRGDVHEGDVVGAIMGLRIVLGLVCMALSPVLALFFDYSTTTNQLILVGTVGFFFTYLGTSLGAIFQRHLAMTKFALAGTFNRVLFLALALACAYSELGLMAYMLVLGATQVLTFVVQVFLARPLVSLRPRYQPALWRKALRVGWPSAVMNALGMLCMQGDLLLLAHFFPDGVLVGVYALPFRILFLIVSTFPGLLLSLLLPQLSRSWHRGQQEEFEGYLQSAFDFFALTLMPTAVGCLVLADDLVVMVGGPQFSAAGDVLRIQIISLAATFFGILYRQAAVAMEAERRLVLPSIATSVLALISYVAFIPGHDMWGAAWTKAGYTVALLLLTYGVLQTRLNHMPRMRTAAKGALATGFMYAAMVLVPSGHLLITIAISAAAYGAGLLATRAVTPTAIRGVLKALRPC